MEQQEKHSYLLLSHSLHLGNLADCIDLTIPILQSAMLLGRKLRWITCKADLAPVLESLWQQKSGPGVQMQEGSHGENILAAGSPSLLRL